MTLGALFILFGLPPIAAYLMYFTNSLPLGRSNKGHLISPVIALPVSKIQSESRTTTAGISKPELTGKWTLIMIVNQDCDFICEKNIYLMRQVRTALGKNNHNVQRLLLVDNFKPTQGFQKFIQDYPQMTVLSSNTQANNTIPNSITSTGNNSLVRAFKKAVDSIYKRIFIVDPQGNLMMVYQPELEPKDLLSDLKRLILVNNNS